MKSHIVLLGDSIFDNARYTLGEPDAIRQVRELLPAGQKATLLAVDGAMCENIAVQLQGVPPDASHLVVSVGGNNAIMHAGILSAPASSTSQALTALADVWQRFEEEYRCAIAACLQRKLPLTVCTIYNGCFPDAAYQRLISTVLMVFNDVILRVAIEHGLPVIDLRLICVSPEDYANPIEPASAGGAKIARAIVNSIALPQKESRCARVVFE